MDNNLYKTWAQLLSDFQALPDIELNRTFMQISGYPHYENVCSNILGFYFDPFNEHGLKDLLYQALLKCVPALTQVNIDALKIDVDREVNCSGKRLDLLLTSDQYIIGIENKVWHTLNNDLSCYRLEIDRQAKNNGLEPIYIVLGIRKESPKADFVSITYSELFSELKSLIGHYSIQANSKYLIYLNDFIKTIEDLQGDDMENEAQAKFFKEHFHSIKRLNDEFKQYQGTLNLKISELKGMLEPDIEDPLVSVWVCSKSILVFDFNFPSGVIALDIEVDPSEWIGTIFPRNKQNKNFDTLMKTLKTCASDTSNNKKTLFKLPLESELSELKSQINQIYDAVLRHSKSLI